jgi:hypothetical protein
LHFDGRCTALVQAASNESDHGAKIMSEYWNYQLDRTFDGVSFIDEK